MTSTSTRGYVVAGLVAFVVGVLIATQARVNGALAIATGNGIEAALVSFGSGWIILTIALVLWRPLRTGMASVAQALREGRLAWWQLVGGLIGGMFVGVQSMTVPLIGVAVFLVAVVAGQSASSIVVDRLGLGPGGRRSVTLARVIAAVLAVIAVAISVSDRVRGEAQLPLPAVLAAFAIGCAIAVQQAFNGRIAQESGSSLAATWINFALGTMLLGVLLGALWGMSDFDPGPLPTGNPWLYLGGLIGIAFIAGTAWVVQRLGVLLYALLSIAGQLLCALVLDWLLPTPGTTMHVALVVGIAVAGLAVAVGSLPAWSHRVGLPWASSARR